MNRRSFVFRAFSFLSTLTGRLMPFCKMCLMTCVMLFATSGCSYLNIPAMDNILAKPDKKTGNNDAPVFNSAVVKGVLAFADKNGDATLIAAYRLSNGAPEVTGYAIVNRGQTFMLYLPEGLYTFCAFTDYNRNGIYENEEASGCYGSPGAPGELLVREGTLTTDVVIRIFKNNKAVVKLPMAANFNENGPLIRQITQNGQVHKIYSEYFSPQNAQTGYWNPSSFMKAFGAHIYLTEEYNPAKIPVLFIHGTEGTPHNWIYIYMRLDRSRYQPWFFYYPSGIRLHLAAVLLNEELRELHRKYRFKKIALVAHSVGGLTTRHFLNRYAAGHPNHFIKLFVSFATPWSGFSLADASQALPHKSIPAWVDLGTQSDFIKTTLDEKFPSHIRHYIFYGKNDTLSGNKAVDDRALACAVKSYGNDCTHDSILSDRAVFAQFNAILEKELW